jgi:hypothetical protein
VAGGAPDCIDLERHRDLTGRRAELISQWVLLLLFCVLPVVALFNVFGQAPSTKTVANPNGAATLTLQAPSTVRSGDIFQARFDIRAQREIKDAVLVLDPGWFESLTINTIEPSPSKESSHDGQLALDLGDIPAGKLWRQFMEFQVNPVNLGSQGQGVTLYDGNVALAHMSHSMRIWP